VNIEGVRVDMRKYALAQKKKVAPRRQGRRRAPAKRR